MSGRFLDKVAANGVTSDENIVHFGIREASSELNEKGFRVFKINGKPILVRGGGWAPDMFLRPSAEREIQELRYVKDMNLNAIRFEGKTENGRFLELCDREGRLAYLENSNERNTPLYERNGFRVLQEWRAPRDGPPIWFMARSCSERRHPEAGSM